MTSQAEVVGRAQHRLPLSPAPAPQSLPCPPAPALSSHVEAISSQGSSIRGNPV